MKKLSTSHHEQTVDLVDVLRELERDSNRHELNILSLDSKFNDLS